MKKIVCLLLAVLFAGMMAAPAMAAIYELEAEPAYRPDLHKIISDMFAVFLETKNKDAVAAAMPYYAVYYMNRSSHHYLSVFFSNGPVILGNETVKFINVYWDDKTALRTMNSTTSMVKDIAIHIHDNFPCITYLYGITFNITEHRYYENYYVSDFSTAYINGQFELSVNYDWIIRTVEEVPTDKNTLQSLADVASGITNTGYTTKSWQAFRAQLETVQTLLDNADATQEEVDAAAAALQTAMDGLEIYIAPPPGSSDPPRPPPGDGGYTVPQDMIDAVSTGSVIQLLTGFIQPFLSHATSAMPIVVGLFAILLGIKIAPRIFKSIFRRW